MELCAASLDKLYLPEDNINKYTELKPTVEAIFIQLAKGLEHIHGNNLVHRDLKPENALIWVGPGDGGKQKVTLKWADFGLSKETSTRGSFSISAIKGTYIWLSPELLELYNKFENLPSERLRSTFQSDVFAQGLTFAYVLLAGGHLYGAEKEEILGNLRKNNAVNLKSMISQYVA